jgi:hypothetical protein
MQSTDIDGYTNKGGWYVKHDGNENMFTVVAANGTTLAGKYTKRKFAEMALKKHLHGSSKPIIKKEKSMSKPIVVEATA